MAADKYQETRQVLLDSILTVAKSYPNGPDESGSRIIYNLAEAIAWLTAANQPHGGGALRG